MSNNNVKDWGEFQKLAELPQLQDLLFVGKWHAMVHRPVSGEVITELCVISNGVGVGI